MADHGLVPPKPSCYIGTTAPAGARIQPTHAAVAELVDALA